MLENLTPPEHRRNCAVRTQGEKLSIKDQEIFYTAIIDDGLWKAKTLSKALRERGIVLSDDAITKHRRGYCSCLIT